MRRRETIAGIFVVVMLALGAAVMLHWHSLQPRGDFMDNPNSIEWVPANAAESAAAEHTISAQLDAFRANDFQKASMYQSEMLRIGFESVQNFRAVIMLRYPQFCTFAQVKYGLCVADTSGTSLRVQVLLFSKQGTATRALYFLRRENGIYRVSEVIADPEMFFGSHGPLHSDDRVGFPPHAYMPHPSPAAPYLFRSAQAAAPNPRAIHN